MRIRAIALFLKLKSYFFAVLIFGQLTPELFNKLLRLFVNGKQRNSLYIKQSCRHFKKFA